VAADVVVGVGVGVVGAVAVELEEAEGRLRAAVLVLGSVVLEVLRAVVVQMGWVEGVGEAMVVGRVVVGAAAAAVAAEEGAEGVVIMCALATPFISTTRTRR
jgi:hypothetical protein